MAQQVDGGVCYRFVRYLGDFPTSDRVDLDLNMQGEILSYQLCYLGSMRHAKPIPDSLVQGAMNAMGRFAESDGTISIKKVVVTSDGRLALDCEVEIPGDGASFLIYLTEPTE